MKPNTRILDYTALVQDGVLTLDDVPQDIAKEVTKWVRYLSGVTDNGMVKDDTPVPTVQNNTVDTKPLLPKVGD
ncbi:MAG: hypothetical protein ACIRZX_01380 [Lactobacillus crispatus]